MTEAPKFFCGNCKYAFRGNAASEQVLCRRFPPSVFQSELDIVRDEATGNITNSRQSMTQFPVVHVNNWCGEHKRVPEGK